MMTKRFTVEALQAIITPYRLTDVLETLRGAGLISGYAWDFQTKEIEIDIPKDVEIKEVMRALQNMPEGGKRRGGH